jgi:putative nucleotidyltransferase with HDIG domain
MKNRTHDGDMNMETMKTLVTKHFEVILILAVTLALVITNYFIDQKMAFLNLYYLPVLISGYFLGRKQAMLTGVFIVGFVGFIIVYNGDAFREQYSQFNLILNIIIWGGFLLLAAYTVGTLYDQKQKQLNDIKKAYVGIVEILAKYLEASDRYTKGHSVRVADLAMEIGIAMQMTRDEVENIRVASLLHDIGKVEISSEIINKAAKLTQEEKQIIDQHAEKGAKILSSVGVVLEGAIQIVLSHHRHFIEKTDKNGQPIPFGARILAVADSYDAMVSDRPYRKGMTSWEAMHELERCSGTQFDPGIVSAFKLVIAEKI